MNDYIDSNGVNNIDLILEDSRKAKQLFSWGDEDDIWENDDE